MIALLLDRKLRSCTDSRKVKGKEKEGEYYISENTESEDPEFEILESSSEEERNLESRDNHSNRMSGLKKCIEALTN